LKWIERGGMGDNRQRQCGYIIKPIEIRGGGGKGHFPAEGEPSPRITPSDVASGSASPGGKKTRPAYREGKMGTK